MGVAQDTTPVAVRQLNASDHTVVVKNHVSIRAASDDVGVDAKLIRECLAGNAPTAGGFTWDYEDVDRRAATHAARDARNSDSFTKHGVWRICSDGDRMPFVSGADAARKLEVSHIEADKVHAMICKSLNGHTPREFGFRWEYEDRDKRARAEETRRRAEEKPKKNKPVWRIGPDGVHVSFDSISQAVKEMNMPKCAHTSISRSLGTDKMKYEYTWKYQ